MKIAIYNANLHTMGGGEKYMGVIAEALAENNEVDILCTIDVDKDKLCSKLDLDLSKVKIIPLNVENDSEVFSEKSKDYDLFINSTYFSKLKSQCPNSIMVLFFPWIEPHQYPLWVKKGAYKLLGNTLFKNKDDSGNNILNRFYASQQNFFEKRQYLRTYGLFISISHYTHYWVSKELGVPSELLYPPVDTDGLKPGEKENIFMSVGRFFIHSHNKKQLEMIKVWKELYDENKEVMKDYSYYLCGSVADDDESRKYVEQCKKEAEGYPINIKTDMPIDDLRAIYSKAKIFWHATGMGENIRKNPDKFEHFGITTVEAMAAGVVPVVINKAGQSEVVKNNVDGYLWNNKKQLKSMTLDIVKNEEKRKAFAEEAIKSSKLFSKENMIRDTKRIVENFLSNK